MTNNKSKQIVVLRTNKRKREEVDVVVRGGKRKSNANHGGYIVSRPITAPSGAGTISGASRPLFKMKSDEIVCVSNTEIFNTFNVGAVSPTLSMNQACIPGSFPWLAAVALSFGKWRWKSLRLIYVPNCPTTTIGALTLGFYYDTNDASPTTRLILAAARDTVSIPPWAGWEGSQLLSRYYKPNSPPPGGAAVIDFDVTKCQKPWYPFITSGNFAALSTVDRNIYCPGIAYGVAEGTPTTVFGTVYASYEVELIEPMSGASQN